MRAKGTSIFSTSWSWDGALEKRCKKKMKKKEAAKNAFWQQIAENFGRTCLIIFGGNYHHSLRSSVSPTLRGFCRLTWKVVSSQFCFCFQHFGERRNRMKAERLFHCLYLLSMRRHTAEVWRFQNCRWILFPNGVLMCTCTCNFFEFPCLCFRRGNNGSYLCWNILALPLSARS